MKEGSEEGTSLNMDEGPEKTEEKATNTVEGADNQNINISKNTLSIGNKPYSIQNHCLNYTNFYRPLITLPPANYFTRPL